MWQNKMKSSILLLRDCLCLNLASKPLQFLLPSIGKLQRLFKAINIFWNCWCLKFEWLIQTHEERDKILWTQSIHVAFIIFGYMLLSKASCWIFFGKHSTGWISQTSKWCVFHQLLLNHCAFIKAFDNFNCNYLFNDASSVLWNF